MSKKLFTPGPSNVPQNIRVQLAKDIIHHRMKDFHKILYGVTDKLKKVFHSSGKMLILTSSGTGAMESSIVNLFSKGDEVLVINTGFFGDRFIQISEAYDLTVHHLDYEWGKSFNLDEVKEMINKNPKIKGVFVTHHETSTGVVNPLKELGEFIATTKAILIADCISGMIAHPFYFDEWHIDCALASSQKGFALPPGLAFVSLSEKALKLMSQSNLPKYYFNYQKYFDYFKKGETPYTPAISLVIALDMALTEIICKSIESIVEEKIAIRHYLEQKLIDLGFKLFIEDESIRGNVLVPVLKGNHSQLNLTKLVEYLDERYNIQVSKGQGHLTNDMLRVGIISDFSIEDIDELICRLVEYMNKE